jgi:hypothetical protein
MAAPEGFTDKVAFVPKVADKLRGHLTPHEYGSVMLPCSPPVGTSMLRGNTRNSRQHPRQGPPGSGDVSGGQPPQ